MKELAQLGLELGENIPIDILLSENFNGSLYGMTKDDMDKVQALRMIVAEYNRYPTLDKKPKITDSHKAASLIHGKLKDLAHEEVWVAYLTASNAVISVEMVFRGALTSVVISPRVVLAKALSLNASSIILYHNHPSESVLPSPNDIKVTNNLKKSCTLLEIALIDHLIIGKELYYSFADERTFKIKNNDSNDIQ